MCKIIIAMSGGISLLVGKMVGWW